MSKMKPIRKKCASSVTAVVRISPSQSKEVVSRNPGQGVPLSKFPFGIQQSMENGMTLSKLIESSDGLVSQLLKLR